MTVAPSEIEQVISSDMCVGCGSCAFAFPENFAVKMSEDGHWRARLNSPPSAATLEQASTLCPMSGRGENETTIAAALYPDAASDSRIGRSLRNLAGHVAADGFREGGSSGGLGSWVLVELMKRKIVDAVIHVQPIPPTGDDRLLFHFAISETVEQVRKGAKSRYYPIEMSDVLRHLSQSDRRFAVVGLPCFVKAVRKLEIEGRLPKGRVVATLSLFCGHLKSRYFGEYLAWQKGVAPAEIAAFDFRRKLPTGKALDYGFAVRSVDGAEQVHPMASVSGKDWGVGIMKNPACEYCDDVVGECADISVGDAWLPGYGDDPKGTNVAVVRSDLIAGLVEDGLRTGALAFDDVTPDMVAESQSSGLRHRREGLAHRLARRAEAGAWSPAKRVAPALADTRSRRAVYDYRLKIAQTSSRLFAEAKAADDLQLFETQMGPLIGAYYNAVYPAPLIKRPYLMARRVAGKLKRMILASASASSRGRV